MSEIIKEFKKGDLLYIGDNKKAYWGLPQGYPYKEGGKTVIEWDGNTNGKETFWFGNISKPFNFYKVSDVTVSAGDLLGAASQIYDLSIGRPLNFEVTSNLITDYTEYGSIMIMNPEAKQEPNIVVILDSGKMAANGINASEGIYFLSKSDYFINMLTYGSETIHPMATVFLPQATSATHGTVKQMSYLPNATGAAPTAEEFNALLKSLRDAGILATS